MLMILRKARSVLLLVKEKFRFICIIYDFPDILLYFLKIAKKNFKLGNRNRSTLKNSACVSKIKLTVFILALGNYSKSSFCSCVLKQDFSPWSSRLVSSSSLGLSLPSAALASR